MLGCGRALPTSLLLPCKLNCSPINKSVACKALTQSGSSRGVTSSFPRQPTDVVRLPQIQLGRAFIAPSLFILPPFNCHGAGPIPVARTSGEKPQHKARNVSRAHATAGMGEAEQVPEPSSESALMASCCSLGNHHDNTITGPKSHITL